MSSAQTVEEINRLVSDNATLRERVEALEQERGGLWGAAQEALEAFEFTRQYVGYDMLPALPGWSWYDACERLRAALAAEHQEPQEAKP